MELSLDPSELERLDPDSMAARYEQTLREQQNNDGKEDFSDMVAEHAAKQKVNPLCFNVSLYFAISARFRLLTFQILD